MLASLQSFVFAFQLLLFEVKQFSIFFHQITLMLHHTLQLFLMSRTCILYCIFRSYHFFLLLIE
jgi:hypothetical protein